MMCSRTMVACKSSSFSPAAPEKALFHLALRKSLGFLVENVSRQDDVYHHLAESQQFGMSSSKETISQGIKLVRHEKIPGDIQGVLFGNTLVLVILSHFGFLLAELGVGHTSVVHVVDESGKNNGQ
jgi:hypothetical protein